MDDLPTIEKARQNLEAASTCLGKGYHDAVANRAYYAIFQAVQMVLTARGIPPTPGRPCMKCGHPINANRAGRIARWPHGIGIARGLGLLPQGTCPGQIIKNVEQAYILRIKADYQKGEVSAEEAAATRAWAEEIVHWSLAMLS